jgi:hypothetical protein
LDGWLVALGFSFFFLLPFFTDTHGQAQHRQTAATPTNTTANSHTAPNSQPKKKNLQGTHTKEQQAWPSQ